MPHRENHTFKYVHHLHPEIPRHEVQVIDRVAPFPIHDLYSQSYVLEKPAGNLHNGQFVSAAIQRTTQKWEIGSHIEPPGVAEYWYPLNVGKNIKAKIDGKDVSRELAGNSAKFKDDDEDKYRHGVIYEGNTPKWLITEKKPKISPRSNVHKCVSLVNPAEIKPGIYHESYVDGGSVVLAALKTRVKI